MIRMHDTWREQFSRAARRDRDKARLLHEQQVREAEELRHEARAKDTEMADLVFGALAAPAEVAAFRVRLDRYDEATVAALMKNEQDLTDVRRRLDEMLGNAHVLPDGRRVFRTRDGRLVFDEHGQQVGEDQIVPGEIADHRTPWEEYSAQRGEERRLLREREDILRFQERIDATRERLDDKDLTQQELDELRETLEQAAPTAVLREMPGYIERATSAPGEQVDVAAGRPLSSAASIRSFDQLVPQ